MQNSVILCCLLVYITIHTTGINATHFEGGTITYKVLNTFALTVSILLTQTYIYDNPKIYCNNSMIANQSPELIFNASLLQENYANVSCIQCCNQSGEFKALSVVSYCINSVLSTKILNEI
jgi:hypothetical protein